MKPHPRNATLTGLKESQFTLPGFGVRDSGFVGFVGSGFVGSGFAGSGFVPVRGFEVPVEGFAVPIHARSRGRLLASPQDLPHARGKDIHGCDLLRGCEFQSDREFELGFAFRVRAKSNHNVTPICHSFVAMALGNVRGN
jgi:hypothetical protein